MSKNLKEELLPTPEPVESFNHTAHDVYWDGRRKAFMLVTVVYNRKTGNAKVESSVQYADSKSVAVYKAKELIVKKVFYSNLDNKTEE